MLDNADVGYVEWYAAITLLKELYTGLFIFLMVII